MRRCWSRGMDQQLWRYATPQRLEQIMCSSCVRSYRLVKNCRRTQTDFELVLIYQTYFELVLINQTYFELMLIYQTYFELMLMIIFRSFLPPPLTHSLMGKYYLHPQAHVLIFCIVTLCNNPLFFMGCYIARYYILIVERASLQLKCRMVGPFCHVTSRTLLTVCFSAVPSTFNSNHYCTRQIAV